MPNWSRPPSRRTVAAWWCSISSAFNRRSGPRHGGGAHQLLRPLVRAPLGASPRGEGPALRRARRGADGAVNQWWEELVVSRGLHAIAAPFVVAPPSGVRVRTRLMASPEDAAVLGALGCHLASLAGTDL